jgi:hypothetical protein
MFRYHQSYHQLKPHDGCPVLSSQSPRGNAKTVLANFFVLSMFGQFDYELETHLLKSEHHFYTQHLLPRALTATIYEAYQADIYLSLEDFSREVARWRTRWVSSTETA